MIIKANTIGKRFNRDWIFRNLSFTFTPNNIYAITGPNGSGKSTLLQILWAQMPPTTGTIVYESSTQILVPRDELYKQATIAAPYMELVEELTLLEQLRLHFRLRRAVDNIKLTEVLERMQLIDARNKPIHNFSSGMKQRLKLGLAFYTTSNIIFLDEPSTNLDDQAFSWYLKNLEEAKRERLVIIASNQKEEYPHDAKCLNINDFK